MDFNTGKERVGRVSSRQAQIFCVVLPFSETGSARHLAEKPVATLASIIGDPYFREKGTGLPCEFRTPRLKRVSIHEHLLGDSAPQSGRGVDFLFPKKADPGFLILWMKKMS